MNHHLTLIPLKKIGWVFLLLHSAALFGQPQQALEMEKGYILDTNMLLICIALFLLLPIWILSNAFIASTKIYLTKRNDSGTAKGLIPFGLCLMSSNMMAQDIFSVSTPGLTTPVMTILLICTICAELFLIIFFAIRINDFGQHFKSKVVQDTAALPILIRLKKDPIAIVALLGLVFTIGYIYRQYFADSEPIQIEYKEELQAQARIIDETNVPVMTGADIEAGKKTFVTLCAVCHKTNGGGLVGPNLTDEYWLHGGSLQHIFKTIKYGVPAKAMISWKEQLSPMQIAQVANYVLTLQGTNPPDCKAKQGELYVAEVSSPAISADSLAARPIDARK